MTRYSDPELMEFKNLIEEKLRTAENEFSIMNQQLEELKFSSSNQGGDISDDVSITAGKEMLIKKASRQQHFIKNLKNALVRIDNKSYGICSITGELIDKKRLLLVPHATKSIVAKQSSAAISNANKGKARIVKPKISKKIITKPKIKATKSSNITSNNYRELDDSNIDEVDMMLDNIEELDLNREDLKNEFEEE